MPFRLMQENRQNPESSERRLRHLTPAWVTSVSNIYIYIYIYKYINKIEITFSHYKYITTYSNK